MNLPSVIITCLFFLCFSKPARAVVVAVAPSQFTSFSLDMDGDGLSEISRFQSTAGAISYDLLVDGANMASFVNFPVTTFAGFESQLFTDLAALLNSDLFFGTYVAPSVITREFNNFSGFGFVTSSTPIQAYWSYGTSGNGSDPFRLLGVVIDYRDYFSSGGIADIDLYYHDYGSFSPSQSSGPITLSSTGIPEPTSSMLMMLSTVVGILRRRK